MKFNKLTISLLGVLILFCSCTKSPYDKLVKKEATKNIVLDSLPFNFHFGDSKQHFFEKCMALNKQEIIKEGPNNKYAQFILQPKNEDESPIEMLFYGSFDDNKVMTGMDLLFSFNFWTAWSDEYTAKNLMPQVKDTLLKWYPGNDFIPIKIPTEEIDAFVKVDANRQILLYINDTKDVTVKIEDLRTKYPSKYN